METLPQLIRSLSCTAQKSSVTVTEFQSNVFLSLFPSCQDLFHYLFCHQLISLGQQSAWPPDHSVSARVGVGQRHYVTRLPNCSELQLTGKKGGLRQWVTSFNEATVLDVSSLISKGSWQVLRLWPQIKRRRRERKELMKWQLITKNHVVSHKIFVLTFSWLV